MYEATINKNYLSWSSNKKLQIINKKMVRKETNSLEFLTRKRNFKVNNAGWVPCFLTRVLEKKGCFK